MGALEHGRVARLSIREEVISYTQLSNLFNFAVRMQTRFLIAYRCSSADRAPS